VSSSIFPVLPGRGFSTVKTPRFRTKTQQASSGREFRLGYWSYPLWNFALVFNVLRDTPNVEVRVAPFNELVLIEGLFLSMLGSFDNFLFDDVTDDAVTDHLFGTGDGAKTQFQLVRAWGGFAEPVMNVNALTNIKKAGVAQNNPTDYTISSTGLVTFAVAPAAAAALTWTGTYYYRCRFEQDELDFDEFLYNLWQLKKCELVGSLGNKI